MSKVSSPHPNPTWIKTKSVPADRKHPIVHTHLFARFCSLFTDILERAPDLLDAFLHLTCGVLDRVGYIYVNVDGVFGFTSSQTESEQKHKEEFHKATLATTRLGNCASETVVSRFGEALSAVSGVT